MQSDRAQSSKMYGWFDAAGQTEPTYAPPRDGPCIICSAPVHAEDVRTINMMWTPDQHPERSYFYYLHRSCHEALPRPKQDEVDGLVWDEIQLNGD